MHSCNTALDSTSICCYVCRHYLYTTLLIQYPAVLAYIYIYYIHCAIYYIYCSVYYICCIIYYIYCTIHCLYYMYYIIYCVMYFVIYHTCCQMRIQQVQLWPCAFIYACQTKLHHHQPIHDSDMYNAICTAKAQHTQPKHSVNSQSTVHTAAKGA